MLSLTRLAHRAHACPTLAWGPSSRACAANNSSTWTRIQSGEAGPKTDAGRAPGHRRAGQVSVRAQHVPQAIVTVRTHQQQHHQRGPAPTAAQQQQQGAGEETAAPAFELLRVKGDGSCMFRAVAQGAAIAASGAPLSPQAETQAALELRRAVVTKLEKRRSDLEPFIPGILEGDVTFEAYLQRMSEPSAWGGEPELSVAVAAVKLPIHVWRASVGRLERVITYGEELQGSAKGRIDLLWHSAGHYDLLLDKKTGVMSKL